MIKKQECVAMLLAGGQGSRLKLLTEKTAKPAVTFGGKYRIIDFPLSNCVNSGIETVGVLTQYQPLALNEYIGNGRPWDLDRAWGGVMVLPPYQASKHSDWYKGTANAIYQNLNFIRRYDPEYVLVLSGDHIYKMDYRAMLSAHKKNNADCTIAVINVPKEETSRFGIMSTYDNEMIYKFEEKPKSTDSTKASMGVYIFSTAKLIKYLEEDEANPESENDFGKNVIPAMLKNGERMFAYPFEGYWKDVGTLDSLWEANMDLLGENPKLDLRDLRWRISSRNNADPPHFAGDGAKITNSMVTEGCEIYGTVENSVLGSDIRIEKGAVVRDSVIFGNVTVGACSAVDYSIVDSDTVIGSGCRVGVRKDASRGITLVGGGLNVPDGCVIPDKTNADEAAVKELAAATV